MKKLTKKIIFALFVLEALYVLGVLVFLNTGLFDRTLALNPQELKVTVGSGWSWIPGIVHLRGFRIWGQDQNVIWDIRLPEAQVQISLKKLLKKEVHFFQVSSKKLNFKLDIKTDQEKRDHPVPTDPTPVSEKKKRHWKLVFDSISLKNVQRLQVGSFYAKGDIAISGGFYLWPALEAEIGPAKLSISNGRVYATGNSQPLVENIHGKFEVKIDRFITPEINSNDVFNYFHLQSSFQGAISNIHYLTRYYLLRTPEIQVSEGDGAFSANLAIRKGIIEEPSQFKFDSKRIRISAYRLEMLGKGKVTAEVHGRAGKSRSNLVAKLEDFKLFFGGKSYPSISGKSLLAEAKSPDLGLVSLFSRMDYRLSVPQASLLEMDKWRFLPGIFPHIRFKSGAGEAGLTLFAQQGRLGSRQPKGFVHLNLPGIEGEVDSGRVSGKVLADFQIDSFDLKNSVGRVPRGKINLGDMNWFSKKWGDPRIQNWNADFLIDDFLLDFKKEVKIQGKARFQAKSSDLVLEILRETKHLSLIESQLLLMKQIDLRTDVSLNSGHVFLKDIELKSDRVSAIGNLWTTPQGASGAISLRSGILKAGLKISESKVAFKLFPSRSWFEIQAPENEKTITLP